MNQRTKIPWTEIKTRYETGKYTIRQLAEEYGFSLGYGYTKAREEGWERGKSAPDLHKEATKKAFEEEVNKEAELRREYNLIFTNIRRATAQELFPKNPEKKPSFDRLKQLKISSEILANCRKEDWELNEIREVAKRQEITGDGGGPIETREIMEELSDEQRIGILKVLAGEYESGGNGQVN